MQPNRSMLSPAPAGTDRAFAPAHRLLPASVREGDRLLRLLAGLRAILVVHLARAASTLAAHDAWHLCSFRTRTDFARERLHRDGRWLRDMVRLHEGLERLPKLLPALCGLDGGRPVGQVAALLVARVATPDTVDFWIKRARHLELDDLRAEIRAHLRRETEASNPAPDFDPKSAASPEDEEEPQVTLSEILPPDVKWVFEAGLDLYRCIEGNEASVNSFVYALVGEAASSGCVPPDGFVPRVPIASRRDSHPLRKLYASDPRTHPWMHPSPGPHADGVAGEALPGHSSVANGSSRFDREPMLVLALHTQAMRRAIQRLSTFDRLHRSLTRLGCKLQAAPTKASRTYRHDVRRVVRILEHLLRLEDGLEIDLADLLLEMHEHEAWEALGFPGLEAYAEARLGLGGSTARRRVALARDLRKLPVVRQAYENGRIGFLGAEWVARGLRRIRADAKTQKTWITHASSVTIRRLRHEERERESQRLLAQIAVARAMTPVSPARPGAPDLPNSQSGTAKSAAMRTANHFPSTRPWPLTPTPMDDSTWCASLRRVPGETRSRVIDLGYDLLDRLLHGGPLTRAGLTLRLDEATAIDLLGCIEAARRGLGVRARADTTPADDRQLSPAARIAGFFVERGLRVPEWVGLLALLEEWIWVHDEPRLMPRHPNRHILERDGYRCMAPGCTSRGSLHVHHIRYRSQEGNDENWNLITLCAYHHLQGEHGGLARVTGRAPLDVAWRLGCDELATHYCNDRMIKRGCRHDSMLQCVSKASVA